MTNDARNQLRCNLTELLGATTRAASPAEEGCFNVMRADFERLAQPLRHELLTSPLAWAEEDRRNAAWLRRGCDDLATVGYRLATHAADRLGGGDEASARDLVAAALFYMGETVKWDVSVASDAPHDLRKVHILLNLAMKQGRHRVPMQVPVEGRMRDCTIEALYFRVLLLARFASGSLNGKQIEILDAWMWLWMPVLLGVEQAPPGTPLRADLDSAAGLQQGPRANAGPSLYLPREPIEAAFHEVVAQFHAGRIVPSEGIASEFRIEEHVAVMALARRNLRQGKREPMQRAARRPVDRPVELFVGLAEIVRRGFTAPPPRTARVALAPVDSGVPGAKRHEHDIDTLVGGMYDAERRIVRLLDESESGLGMEGDTAQLDGVAAGDLVAVRLAPGEPLVYGKVVRSVAAKARGRTVVGVRILSGSSRLVDVTYEAASRPENDTTLVFVAGTDTSGRQDGLLVSERDFRERSPMLVATDSGTYRVRLNRVRERGRGWVLAGFEVIAAQAREAEAA